MVLVRRLLPLLLLPHHPRRRRRRRRLLLLPALAVSCARRPWCLPASLVCKLSGNCVPMCCGMSSCDFWLGLCLFLSLFLSCLHFTTSMPSSLVPFRQFLWYVCKLSVSFLELIVLCTVVACHLSRFWSLCLFLFLSSLLFSQPQ